MNLNALWGLRKVEEPLQRTTIENQKSRQLALIWWSLPYIFLCSDHARGHARKKHQRMKPRCVCYVRAIGHKSEICSTNSTNISNWPAYTITIRTRKWTIWRHVHKCESRRDDLKMTINCSHLASTCGYGQIADQRKSFCREDQDLRHDKKGQRGCNSPLFVPAQFVYFEHEHFQVLIKLHYSKRESYIGDLRLRG